MGFSEKESLAAAALRRLLLTMPWLAKTANKRSTSECYDESWWKFQSLFSLYFLGLLSQGDIGYQLKALDGGALFVGMREPRCESRCQPWNVIMQNPSTSSALQKEKRESSIKVLLSWQCCPVWSVLIKGSWVVKRSLLSESPPPHCLKTQHTEFKFNFFWTRFLGEVQFDFFSLFCV